MHPPSSANQGNDSTKSEWHHPIFEDTERYPKSNGSNGKTNGHPFGSASGASPFTMDEPLEVEPMNPWMKPSAAPSQEAAAAAPVPQPSRPRSAIWTGVALVVGVLAVYILVSELTTASSMQGATVGNLINLRAAAPGVVAEVLVAEAGEVETGQTVTRLDSAGLDKQLDRIEEVLALKRLEADQVATAIDEEKQRLELLHEISRRTETMLGMAIEELDIQLALATELATELKGSVNRGSAKKFEFLEAESSRLRIAKQLEEKHGELDLQQLITKNAAEGRHYHEGVVRSWLDELQLQATKVATEIGQTELEAATLRTELAHSTVTTHRGGRVFAVHHHPGSSVQAGDPVITLETDDRVWIIASFKYAEAEEIAYGDRATIDFPALHDSISGTVVAIGHNVISATDADSPFLRLTPEEVLVKIEPDSSVDHLRSGMSAQVRIRTGGFSPLAWIGSLFGHLRAPDPGEAPTQKAAPATRPLVPASAPVPAAPAPAPMNSPFDFSQYQR